jgi:hypothetical protein
MLFLLRKTLILGSNMFWQARLISIRLLKGCNILDGSRPQMVDARYGRLDARKRDQKICATNEKEQQCAFRNGFML